MAEVPKKAKKPTDHRVSVKGKVFTWETEDGDTLTIPLRVPMKTLLELNDVALDAQGMFQIVEAIAPDQVPLIERMDANDFTSAYEAWQAEYNGKNGASLGESEGSSS